ncbi:hypothetical protein [Streptomyces sp. A5-4]|uniref:hypothetical protein n=1 Tax=Streptomyces sp. A5-4 TaxID=3384771 RepID=UPI003DAA3F7E
MRQEICGTKVSKSAVAPLLKPAGEVDEYNRIDRESEVSAPCDVTVDKQSVLEIKFFWHSGKMDPLSVAKDGKSSIYSLQSPRRINLADGAVIGNDGAIATIACKTKGGDHFTLALKTTRNIEGGEQRNAIETFMRSYMPATVKTLGCDPA